MISAARWFGNARLVTLGAAAVQRVHPGAGKWWSIKATGVGASVTLPDPSDELVGFRVGFGHLVVACVGRNAIDVKDSGGGTIATLADGELAILSLVSKTGSGRWIVMQKAWA